MSRKHIRHRRAPVVKKYINCELADQFCKIGEEFGELGTENAILSNKARKGERISLEDIKRAAMEAFDISQAAQQYIYILYKKFGKHYCFTVDEIFEAAINKNKVRGYYDETGDLMNE